MKVGRELLDGMHVAANGIGAVVAAPEFHQHPFTKWGHRKLLSVTDATAAYSSKHARHCVRRASGLVLTEYPELSQALAAYVARAAEKLRRENLVARHMLVFMHTSPFAKDAAKDPYYAPHMSFAMPLHT